MGHAEEIAFLDEIREAAIRRLEECEHEVGLTRDLSDGEDEEIVRRRKKLRLRADRYELLIRRVGAEAKEVRSARLDTLLRKDLARLSASALELHERTRKLESELNEAREQYRGIRMRHLALEREAAELGRALGQARPEIPEPPEIRAELGAFGSDPEVEV